MEEEQDAIEEEYQRRVGDLVTTLEELRMLDIPRLDIEQVEEGDTWEDSPCPAAKAWRNVFDIVETHIGGAPELHALYPRIPTSIPNPNWVVQLNAPHWLGDFVNIEVRYHPEGELHIFSTVTLLAESVERQWTFYDGRLSDLDTKQLYQFYMTACKNGPFFKNW